MFFPAAIEIFSKKESRKNTRECKSGYSQMPAPATIFEEGGACWKKPVALPAA
jgi:hypothetical protein